MYWNDGVGENTNPEPGWIVTLDVLKLINAAHKIMIYYGWIVTLDVLKYARCYSSSKYNPVE